MFALDTNTLIDFFRNRGKVAARLEETAPRDVAIPSVVLYEIEYGIRRSEHAEKRRRDFTAFQEIIQVLPFDEPAARAAAEVRAKLEQRGEGIGPMDTLIAGTALAHGAILVTHNTAEFRRVHGLRIEDWR